MSNREWAHALVDRTRTIWIFFPIASGFLLLQGIFSLLYAIENLVVLAHDGDYPIVVRPSYYLAMQSSSIMIVVGLGLLLVSLLFAKWNPRNRGAYDLLLLGVSSVAPNLLLVGNNPANHGLVILYSTLIVIRYSTFPELTYVMSHAAYDYMPQFGGPSIEHASFSLGHPIFILLSLGTIVSLLLLRSGKTNARTPKRLVLLMLLCYVLLGISVLVSWSFGGMGAFPVFVPIPVLPLIGVYLIEQWKDRFVGDSAVAVVHGKGNEIR
ncbi:MAG: hypothetical protein RTU09_01635 [Candidatus Thorarchaeota archaeon]